MELGADLIIEFTTFGEKRFGIKHLSLTVFSLYNFCLYRLLWMLHQMFRRGAVCVVGGYNPLLLWRCPVLWMWPRGSHWHRDHPGNPLLQGHQRPRHADWCVSVLYASATWLPVMLASVWETSRANDYDILCGHLKYCVFTNVYLHNRYNKASPKCRVG